MFSMNEGNKSWQKCKWVLNLLNWKTKFGSNYHSHNDLSAAKYSKWNEWTHEINEINAMSELNETNVWNHEMNEWLNIHEMKKNQWNAMTWKEMYEHEWDECMCAWMH